MMPLQRNMDYQNDPPPKLNLVENDELKEISDLTQRGWLAPQDETDDEEEKIVEHEKHEPNVLDAINEVFETSHLVEKQRRESYEPAEQRAPYTIRREYESMLSHKSMDTPPELTMKPPFKTPFSAKKPFYKSIIAMTAAIIIQNYWRDYRRRKLTRTSDVGTSILQIKRRIENNISLFNHSSTIQEQADDPKEEIAVDKQISIQDDLSAQKSETPAQEEVKLNLEKKKSDLFEEPEVKGTLFEKISKMQALHTPSKSSQRSENLPQSPSPSTSKLKREKVEKWVTADALDNSKPSSQDPIQTTIEIVKNTTKTQARIRKVLSKSVSKRPAIWSDYSQSMHSSSHKGNRNFSLRRNRPKAKDESIHS